MESLPTEILAVICGYLDDSYTLSRLALCSHWLYNIASPFLYSHVNLRSQSQRTRAVSIGSKTVYSNFPHLRALTALCIDKPQIALYVKRLTIRGAFSTLPPPSSRRERTSVKLCKSIRSQIELLSDEKGMTMPKWIDDASNVEGEDSLLAVLILTLSQLETIDFEMPILHDRLKHLLDRVAFDKDSFSSAHPLQKLQSGCFGYDAGVADGALLPSVLALPSVRSVYLHSVASQQRCPSPYLSSRVIDLPALEKSSTCKHLEMRHCRIGARQLSHLLSIPKSLRTFVYIEARDRGTVRNTSFSGLGRAILQQKDTLEEVWVDISHNYVSPRSWILATTDDVGPISSLRTCTKLKRLRIAAVYVFGVFGTSDKKAHLHQLMDLMPESIEELSLTHCETQLREVCYALETLLLARQHCHGFESLRLISIELSRSSLSTYKVQLFNIMLVARSLGIFTRLFNNHSDETSKDHEIQSESGWGYDSKTEWAPCSNKRNQRPAYEEIEVDGNDGNAMIAN